MLVLTRKRAESVKIGNDIVIKVIQTNRGIVKLGIEAPPNVRILRAELAEFTTDPTAVSTESASADVCEDEAHPESVTTEDGVIHFRLDHDLEVDDLMMCVGAH